MGKVLNETRAALTAVREELARAHTAIQTLTQDLHEARAIQTRERQRHQLWMPPKPHALRRVERTVVIEGDAKWVGEVLEQSLPDGTKLLSPYKTITVKTRTDVTSHIVDGVKDLREERD